MIYLLALAIGIVAGLRAMTAPAAVSIGAWLGCVALAATPLAFMASPWVAGLFGLAALGELVSDQLPATPSRKVPVQFGTRLLTGGLSGAAIGAAAGLLVPGLIAGVAGAAIGTYGGAALRSALAARFGRDLPAALIEDVIAVGGAALIVCAL
jgi:uncharacterized membrane protein